MVRCKHGFFVCGDCKVEWRGEGCHYPGCEDAKDWRERQFCPKHGGKFAAHRVFDVNFDGREGYSTEGDDDGRTDD